MASHSVLHSSQILVTADERDRVLQNPMVILAREHMRQCGFTEEDVQRGSAMCTVDGRTAAGRAGGSERSAWSETRAQASGAAGAPTSRPSGAEVERVTVGWGPARHA